MKREIKFRGKRIYNGMWMEGDLKTDLVPKGSMLPCPAISTTKGTIGTFFVKTDTVGQFTGKYDKNGKEIYEGDILRHLNGNTFQVLYSNRTTSFILISISHKEVGLDLGIYDTENCFEVIGNIYDNKELLED
jgi:uncharacterized phage protein (TIGR01671 family)